MLSSQWQTDVLFGLAFLSSCGGEPYHFVESASKLTPVMPAKAG
jgi:hypothetical protein